ncbi:MAG TPA: acyl-CoA dehydrogenase [Thermoplasmatales archaeon]|nr:acyl-CoA dehydrogenase [Thermoplasmatales archaeon]
MDFSFSEEENLWRKTVREFAEKNITPLVREIEKSKQIPDTLLRKMGQLGLLAPTVSKEYGGVNLSWVMSCIAAEELGRADLSLSIPVLYLVEAAWGFILNQYGSQEVKEEYLPRVTKGEAFCGIAVTEPTGGSDIVGSLQTTAEKKGDKWILNGEKMFISGVAESHRIGGVHLTLARTDPSAGYRGFSLFAVPIRDVDGVSITLLEDMGREGISTGGFKMENVILPEYHLLGEVNKGFYYIMEGFSAARTLIGATCVGVAEAGLEMGMEHIKTRNSFGRPIACFEGIQFPLAEHYTNIESVKLLTYKAAWMMDKLYQENSFSHHDIALYAAMSKLRAPQYAFEALNEVADWLGALGYTREYPIEMGIRGVRSYSIGAEGTLNIMRIIIARELLGREFLPYGVRR